MLSIKCQSQPTHMEPLLFLEKEPTYGVLTASSGAKLMKMTSKLRTVFVCGDIIFLMYSGCIAVTSRRQRSGTDSGWAET